MRAVDSFVQRFIYLFSWLSIACSGIFSDTKVPKFQYSDQFANRLMGEEIDMKCKLSAVFVAVLIFILWIIMKQS